MGKISNGEILNDGNLYLMEMGTIGNYHESWESLKNIVVLEDAEILEDVELVKHKAKYSRKSKKKIGESDVTEHVIVPHQKKNRGPVSPLQN